MFSFSLNIDIYLRENNKHELFNIYLEYINHSMFALANGYAVGQSLHATGTYNQSLETGLRTRPNILQITHGISHQNSYILIIVRKPKIKF